MARDIEALKAKAVAEAKERAEAAKAKAREKKKAELAAIPLPGEEKKKPPPAMPFKTPDSLWRKMKEYFDDVDNTEFAVECLNGSCICAAAKSGAYYGTSPIVYTNKNYGKDGTNPQSIGDAIAAAKAKYDEQHTES